MQAAITFVSFFRTMRAITFWLCAFLFTAFTAGAAADSTKPAEPADSHQLRFSVDISRPVLNLARSNQQSYEFMLDYYLRRELYLVLEGGWGKSEYDYPDLSYSSNNPFVRAGIEKTVVKRLAGNDWDQVFLGCRYGVGFVHRSEASYVVEDSVWGTTSGTVESANTTAHWAEVLAGVRVELFPRFMVGWNGRARFLLNDRAFNELAPQFIAGYGQGDKSVVFDFNFYLCYAFRWARKP